MHVHCKDLCTQCLRHSEHPANKLIVPTLQVLQLYQIQQIHHGLMMVGPSGSGKSMAWRVLLKALEKLEGVEGVSHIIDPKVGVCVEGDLMGV